MLQSLCCALSFNVALSISGASWQSPEQARAWSCALNCSAQGTSSSYHNASVRSTTWLPLGEWPRLERLPLSHDLGPFPVRRIGQLLLGRYPHIPVVALVIVRFRCYSKAASVGEMFSTRLQDFWANTTKVKKIIIGIKTCDR